MLLENVAQGKAATQSGVSEFYSYATADKAVDGDFSSVMRQGSCVNADTTHGYHQKLSGSAAWWQVELGQEYDVYEVRITTQSFISAERGTNVDLFKTNEKY